MTRVEAAAVAAAMNFSRRRRLRWVRLGLAFCAGLAVGLLLRIP